MITSNSLNKSIMVSDSFKCIEGVENCSLRGGNAPLI